MPSQHSKLFINRVKNFATFLHITSEKLFTEKEMERLQFERLAERYMDMVFRLAFSMTKNRADADDVTQNALLALYKCEKPFASEQHVKNWLVRVTLNECRKLWRLPRSEDIEDYGSSLVFEEKRFGDLWHAIMSLERKYRVVIELFYMENYSLSEISALLGLPVGTVGTRLSRARSRLKAFLTEADEHD